MNRKKIFVYALVLTMAFILAVCGGAFAAPAGGVLKIGAITSLSGALQDYGEQFQRGLLLGFEYMTNGTNTIAGRPIEIIWEDTTNSPDVARERTMKLLETDKVELVTGYASSADAGASLPLFEEFETVVVIEPAASDTLIHEANWNEYIFRTGRTAGQDAIAMASVIAGAAPGATVAALAPDTTFGYSMVEPFQIACEQRGLTFVQVEYAPQDASDFSPYLLRLRNTAPDYLYVVWAGANNPWMQLLEMNLQGAGVTIVTGAPEIAALRPMLPLGQTGGIGFCVYYHTLPQNEPLNDWLVENHLARHNMPPDIFTSGGFAAASAIVTALESTGGVTDPAVLIPAMEGMEFDSPTGKRFFRVEDHQAMQDLFAVEFTAVDGIDHMVPKWVRNVSAEEITPPVMNGR